MVHGDAKGLRLPPRIAPIQVVIVPIWRTDEERASVQRLVDTVEADLAETGIRVEVDWRDQVRPGFKFNDWELKGVPVRLEVGPRDAAAGQVTVVRRDLPGKEPIAVDLIAEHLGSLLDAVQESLFKQAQSFLEHHISSATSWDDLRARLDGEGGFIWVNWCDSKECEGRLAEEKATVRAIPLDDRQAEATGPCVCCGNGAKFRCVVARSY
jgi:prolyl-tRNA synthetase